MNGRSKLWAIGLLLGVLALGGVVGATADRLILDRDDCRVAERDRDRDGDRRKRYLDWLSTELDLSADQRARVEAVVDRHRERMSEFWKEVRPRFEEMKDELRTDIRAVLSADQRARYEELLEEREKRHRRHDAEKR